ncbi:DUF3558 family protein [Actinoplanes sp. NPDC089786]|uniref:DUF3558 family protein n=1 Tax=Actinoplanes sp. NPDC089786 TaxID=3155185 RepID=UPI00341713C0
MKRPRLAAAALVTFLSLTGCSLLDKVQAAPAPTPAATTATDEATAEPTPSSESKIGSVKDSGDIPDPCTLLSDAEVKQLTGREISQRDEDGASPGDAARFCQWQQPSGQLAVFLSRTTPSDYEVQIDGATEVDGLGEKAFTLAGHLYVLYGTVQVDVYSRGDSDDENLAKEKDVVNVLLPKI